MTLPIDLGKISARGSLNLFYGVVISNIILAGGTVVVARMLGSASYGLYTLSSVPATFFGLFVGFGVRQATVKYSAQFSRHNETEKVRRIVVSGLLLVAISSFVFTLFSLFLSAWIADLFARSYARFLIQISSLTVLTDALIVASQSVFAGLEKMQYYSILLISHAVLRSSVSPILIAIGLGPLGAVIGFTVASLSTCVLGLSAVYFLVIKGQDFNFAELRLLKNLRQLINYGAPLYLRRLMEGAFRTQFLDLLIVIYAGNALIGNYRVALNFQIVVSFFVIPIKTVLFPAFSKLESRLDQNSLRTIFAHSVKYTSLIVIPTTVALIVLSQNVVSTLYGKTYTLAPLYLSLSSLIFFYAAFGQLSITALLEGQGETKKSMILGVANVALAFPLALILIPPFQVVGLIISLILSGLPSFILGSLWVKRLYDASIEWNQISRIFACSFVVGTLTYAITKYSGLSNLFGLFIGLAVFSSSFIILAPLIGVFSLDDISNLRIVFSGMGKMSQLLDMPLRVLSMLCKSVDRE